MPDTLDTWRVFAAVAARKSFVRAAGDLGRSPQAVTRAIAALETRLDTKLLHRTTRSVSLTSEGARLLDRARRVLDEVEALEAPPDPRARLSGTLSVTAPALFGQLHVLPVVDELLARNPALDVRLLLVDRVVALADEGVDVAVRIGALPDSSLVARKVGEVRVVACASAGYLKRNGTPRTPSDLAAHACIAFVGTTPVVDRWAFAGGQHVRVRARLVVNTAQAALDAAARGLGIARVLSYQLRGDALRVLLERHEPPPLPIHVVQLPGGRSRAANAFVELAALRLRERVA